jgi:hypothetical protein
MKPSTFIDPLSCGIVMVKRESSPTTGLDAKSTENIIRLSSPLALNRKELIINPHCFS